MEKIIYLYNRKYCECGIKTMKIDKIMYNVYVDVESDEVEYKSISALISKYNIAYDRCDTDPHYYGVVQCFDDEDIYEYEDGRVNYIMSFNKDKIAEMIKKELKRKRDRLKKDLREVEDQLSCMTTKVRDVWDFYEKYGLILKEKIEK